MLAMSVTLFLIIKFILDNDSHFISGRMVHLWTYLRSSANMQTLENTGKHFKENFVKKNF